MHACVCACMACVCVYVNTYTYWNLSNAFFCHFNASVDFYLYPLYFFGIFLTHIPPTAHIFCSPPFHSMSFLIDEVFLLAHSCLSKGETADKKLCADQPLSLCVFQYLTGTLFCLPYTWTFYLIALFRQCHCLSCPHIIAALF